MKKNLFWIVLILDRSGSMESIKKAMIDGFNEFINNQKLVKIGDCRVFAYKFDSLYEMMFENLDINKIELLTEKNFEPRGNTALYDSVGKTIKEIGQRLAVLKEEDRPEKVLVATITDGKDNYKLENDKTHYTADQVKEMITHQEQVYSWDFIYIGANQNSWEVGASMGISNRKSSINYIASYEGTTDMWDKLSRGLTKYRSDVTYCSATEDAKKVKFAFDEQDETNSSTSV